MPETQSAQQPRSATAKPARRCPPSVDWDIASFMLARGYGLAETAQAVGISRTTLWRALNRAGQLSASISAAQAEAAADTNARIESLRGKVAAHIENQVDRGDTRVVLWLAKQLGMIGPNAKTYADLHRDPDLSEAEKREVTRAALAEDEAKNAATAGSDAAAAAPSATAETKLMKPARNVPPEQNVAFAEALSPSPTFHAGPRAETQTAACALLAQPPRRAVTARAA